MTCLYKCNGLKQGKWYCENSIQLNYKGFENTFRWPAQTAPPHPQKIQWGIDFILVGLQITHSLKTADYFGNSLFQMLLQQVDLLFTAVSPIPINFVFVWMEVAAAAGCSHLCCWERKGPLGCTHPKDSPRELLVGWQLSLILGSLRDFGGFAFFSFSVLVFVELYQRWEGDAVPLERGLWGCTQLSRGHLCVSTQQTDWLREKSAEN